MEFKIIIFYSKLALADEDNNFVAHFLKEGCKIIEQEINEKSQERFKINIDFQYIDKGEKGILRLVNILNSNQDLFFTHAHVINKYNKEILDKINDKKFFYIYNTGDLSKLTNPKNLINTGKADRPARIEFIQDEIKSSNDKNIFFIHNEARLYETLKLKNDERNNFKEFSFKDLENDDISKKIEEVFKDLKKEDLIILDIGLKPLRKIFNFLEDNGHRNRVINNFGSLENRFEQISFDLIQLSSTNISPSLSLEDVINKIYKNDIGPNKKTLLLDSAYRLEYPLLLSQALEKCDDETLKNKDKEKIRSEFLSFDGSKDIFFGKRLQYGFDENGNNIIKDNFTYIFPNSLQIKGYETPKIMFKKQYISEGNIIKKKNVTYAYIDVLRVTNIDIKARFWTAEFYLDIVSDFDNPIDQILFNNLSTLNDKFSHKEIWKRKEDDNYNTVRYYVVANFDFLPVADNYPFDWQNIYIAMTIADNDNHILQPIPLDLVDDDFEIAEWSIQNSFAGIKYQKNRLYQDTDLKKTVNISSENRVGWILKRKNTATLFKIGIPMSFLIFLVYYSVFLKYGEAGNSIGILTTTFLSAIALYFSVEKPEPKRMTIVDLVFVWFYIVNGVTVVTFGMASFLNETIFNYSTLFLKLLIPVSLVSIASYLWKRVRRNREDILLDREI